MNMIGGKDFDLESDDDILKINSPQTPKPRVGGPYAVVYKNIEERWAIVVMKWDGEPRLGMRWFSEYKGFPFAALHPLWFVIPPHLSKNILSGLPIEHQFSSKIDKFLVTGNWENEHENA